MEASWRGCSLHLDRETLTLNVAGRAPVTVPLPSLEAFTVLASGPVVSDRREGVATPDGELLVAWQAGGTRHTARVPVPTHALQVQLFLTRLAQLRPGADLRALPPDEALGRMGLATTSTAPRRRRLALVLGALGVMGALAGAAYLLLAA